MACRANPEYSLAIITKEIKPVDFEKEFAELKAEAEQIIDNLLEDGSDPDAVYTVEHHFAGDNFAQLEKAAIAAFQLGYDVADPEEIELDDGQKVFAFDCVVETELDIDSITRDIEILLKMSIEQDVTYDGWGTYFEESEA